MRAVCATKHLAVAFHAMPYDLAAAVRAGWRDRVNRAFEAIENMRLPADPNFEALVVIVPAYFALGHATMLAKCPPPAP
jgi:hypothetical protein